MIFRGLEAKFAFQVSLLIVIGMILIDMVMVSMIRNSMINATAENAILKMRIIESALKNEQKTPEKILKALKGENEAVFVAIKQNEMVTPYFSGNTPILKKRIWRLCKDALETSTTKIEATGNIWGVFWKAKHYLIAAHPIRVNSGKKAAAAVAVSLEPIYAKLRNSQKIIFVYVILNTVILAMLGYYRLSRMYLKPLRRLAKRAQEYQDEDDLLFSVRKQDNELSRLSNALNQMFRRISNDKKTLRMTVASLENANQDLKRAQNEIVQAEKLASAGRLSSGVAHEIGNPIGIVQGYLSLLKQDFTDEERLDFITRAEDEISRVNTIIRRLLDMSRPAKGDPEKLSVHGLLSDVAEVFRMQPAGKKMVIKSSLQADEDTVFADPDQLRQVFVNILLNAVDAVATMKNGHNGEIEIRTVCVEEEITESEERKKRIRIDFLDNGPGLAKEQIENMFDPFFTTKAPGKGTGLGLSVSFTMVEKMGGRVSAENRTGQGTRMTIILPLQANG